MSDLPPTPRVWAYSLAGALLLFGCVLVANAGGEESSDAIVYAGGAAAAVGALAGAAVGSAVRRRKHR